MKIIECVPNFSEGRRKEVIASICEAARSVKQVSVLGSEADVNHNRMVLTFAGPPDAVLEAALESSGVAIRNIDLTKHTGEHPRMGAVDVVPFIPLRDATLQDCVDIANAFAIEYSKRFDVPVFLYEAAARIPERINLADVRSGQFEGLRELIGKDPKRDPDYGPRQIHPTAGATAVGARKILIAYNVNLKTSDLSVAKRIAHRVRGRDGGLPEVKALGFELRDRQLVQVSMNLTDYKTTSIPSAFERVSECAVEEGVQVLESEIVGLVPMDALVDAARAELKLSNFTRDQIIENGLLEMLAMHSSTFDFPTMTLSDFFERLASKEPIPGGGTASAYAGVFAASLVSMVCRLTIGKKGYEEQNSRLSKMLGESEEYSRTLEILGKRDAEAYAKVRNAIALPKITEEEKDIRSANLTSALKEATEIPIETMTVSVKVLKLASELLKIGNRNAKSDSETAFELSRAAIRGAASNVKINLESFSGEREFVARKRRELEELLSEVN